MKTGTVRIAMLSAVALASVACAPLTPQLDRGLGDAVRLSVLTQTRDRSAAATNAGKDASGLDGAAAKEVLDRYQKSYRAPEPPTSVFTIGMSGASSSR